MQQPSRTSGKGRQRTHQQTWRGQVVEAEPLVARLADAVKHGICNLKVLPLGVVALGDNTPGTEGGEAAM